MKKNTTPFDKFGKRKSNAAIKEEFRQEKRQLKKEREEYFEKKRREAKGPGQQAHAQKSSKDRSQHPTSNIQPPTSIPGQGPGQASNFKPSHAAQ